MSVHLKFEMLTPEEQEHARAMFFDAGPGDGYRYELDMMDRVLCRKRDESHDRPNAKDYFGQDLNVGDRVAFYAPNYRHFTTGEIIAFTEKQVRVKYINNWNFKPGVEDTYLAYPNMFIKKP